MVPATFTKRVCAIVLLFKGLELPNDMLMELMSTWILRSVVKRLVVVEEISEFAVIYDGLNVNGKSLFTVAKE